MSFSKKQSKFHNQLQWDNMSQIETKNIFNTKPQSTKNEHIKTIGILIVFKMKRF